MAASYWVVASMACCFDFSPLTLICGVFLLAWLYSHIQIAKFETKHVY